MILANKHQKRWRGSIPEKGQLLVATQPPLTSLLVDLLACLIRCPLASIDNHCLQRGAAQLVSLPTRGREAKSNEKRLG